MKKWEVLCGDNNYFLKINSGVILSMTYAQFGPSDAFVTFFTSVEANSRVAKK